MKTFGFQLELVSSLSGLLPLGMMSKHPAGLLNYPLKPSQSAGNSEVCPGTPLWTSTNKKLERSVSSDSPESVQDRRELYHLEAPFTEVKVLHIKILL
jgi:hypothetical protein